MILSAVLMLSIQSLVWTISPPTATVGDTVRISRRVVAGPDARFSVLPLVPTDVYVPLSSPVAAYSEGAVVVRYQLAFFETGDHPVLMPDLELNYPDGRTHVFPGDTALVHIGSILPAEDDEPPLRPSLGPVARTQRSLTPTWAILSVLIVCLVSWAVWRRRVGDRPVWARVVVEPPEVPLQQWIMAGESKAAVGVIADRLRDAIERLIPSAGRQLSTRECLTVIQESRPGWPIRDIEGVLRSLDRAQYAPAVPNDVALLVDQVEALLRVIHEPVGEAAEE
jgi:hypothetical protein